MTHWNYRIVDMSEPEGPHFELREVYYDTDGKPTGHCAAEVSSESLDGVADVYKMMQDALAHPVIKFDPEDKKEPQ
jgi:hypothetical protein